MGNGVMRVGDADAGHEYYAGTSGNGGSPNVFVNGRAVQRQGDGWGTHTFGANTHSSVVQTASKTVFINGRPIGRSGDTLSCGASVINGSPTVFAG